LSQLRFPVKLHVGRPVVRRLSGVIYLRLAAQLARQAQVALGALVLAGVSTQQVALAEEVGHLAAAAALVRN
jgi:hypothetical protein